MRTTVSIADELLAAARRRARDRGQTLGQVIDAALRREFSETGRIGERPHVPVFRLGSGVRPGLDLTSNRSLYEALDEGVEPDDRR